MFHSASTNGAMCVSGEVSLLLSNDSSDGMVKKPPLTGVWKVELAGGLLMALGQADREGVGGAGE